MAVPTDPFARLVEGFRARFAPVPDEISKQIDQLQQEESNQVDQNRSQGDGSLRNDRPRLTRSDSTCGSFSMHDLIFVTVSIDDQEGSQHPIEQNSVPEQDRPQMGDEIEQKQENDVQRLELRPLGSSSGLHFVPDKQEEITPEEDDDKPVQDNQSEPEPEHFDDCSWIWRDVDE